MELLIKRREKRRLFKIGSLLTILLLIGTVYFLLKLDPLVVRNITVTTDYDFKANQKLINLLDQAKGKNIFLFNTLDFSQKIKSSDVQIAEAKVDKAWPEELNITIRERQPILAINKNNIFYLVDREGIIFAVSKNSLGLPTWETGLQNLDVGSTIDKETKEILEIAIFLKDKGGVLSFSKTGEDLDIRLKNGVKVFMSLNQAVETQLNSLQTILTNLTIKGELPKRIDLRFEKPVINP